VAYTEAPSLMMVTSDQLSEKSSIMKADDA